MVKKPTILFTQMDLTNSINAFDYLKEFQKDFEVVNVTFANSHLVDDAASELGIKMYHVPFLYDIKVINSEAEIQEELRSIESDIGMPLEKIMFADMEFYSAYKKNEIQSLSWLINVWSQFKEIINSNNISLQFCFGEDRLDNLIPYYLIKNRGGRSYLVRAVPYYGVTYTNDFFGKFTQNYNIKMSAANFDDYKAHVQGSRVYFDHKVIHKINYRKYINLKRLFERIYELEQINWEDRRNIYNHHNIRPVDAVLLKPLTKLVKGNIANSFIYKEIDKDQKYIYYPLHYTDDAQVRLKYPEGYNQYELVRNISRNLPADLKLIVKEHPAYIGNYSLGELRDLSKLPKVVVVNPRTSSKDIMNSCDYIITINSTVGYEALFFDKVVITMGNSFYDAFPGVINIKDVTEIYSILTDEHLIAEKKKEILEKLPNVTMALLESSLKFDYYRFRDEDNIKMLKDLLIRQVNAQINISSASSTRRS